MDIQKQPQSVLDTESNASTQSEAKEAYVLLMQFLTDHIMICDKLAEAHGDIEEGQEHIKDVLRFAKLSAKNTKKLMLAIHIAAELE